MSERTGSREAEAPPPRLSLAAGLCLPVGLGLIMVGLLAGRPDLITFALPILIFVLWGWIGRPLRAGRLTLRADDQQPRPGVIPARLVIEPAPEIDQVLVRVNAPGHRPREVAIDARRFRTEDAESVKVSMETVRTGRRELFWAEWLEAGTAGVTRSDPHLSGPVSITVLAGTATDPAGAAAVPAAGPDRSAQLAAGRRRRRPARRPAVRTG